MEPADRIRKLEIEIENLRAPMQAACDRWLDATVQWIAPLWMEGIEGAVKRQPGVAKKLGLDGLGQLKREINALVESAREQAQRVLIDDSSEYWPHLQADLTKPHETPTRRGGAPMRSEFTLVETHAAPPVQPPHVFVILLGRFTNLGHDLLDRHGLNDRYAFGGAWSEEMIVAARTYAELDTALIEKRRELQHARKDWDEREAADLWERA